MQIADGVKMSKIGKILVALYVVLNPFYLWRSGLPQVSDFLLILLIVWVFIDSIYKSKTVDLARKHSIFSQNYLFFLMGFVYYAALVNLVWALIFSEKISFIRSTLFLVFNLFTLIAFAYLLTFYTKDLIRILQKSLMLSIAIQAAFALVMIGSQGLRTRLFFNNPNQLGYFAVLVAAILTVLYALRSVSLILHIFSLFICVFLTAASLSRGAIVATVMLIVCALVFDVQGLRFRLRFSLKKTLLVAMLSAASAVFLSGPFGILIDSWNERTETKSQSPGLGLEDRGYQRILENMNYWFLGAGEGGLSRFNTSLELHSLFGNIFFSYGLIGFGLFASSILIIVWRNPASLIPLGAVFMYGFSHNGLRDGLLWILVSICGSAFYIFRANLESVGVNRQ